MTPFRYLLPALLVAAVPLAAQSVHKSTVAAVDTAAVESDDEGVRLGIQYGVTTGALEYQDGRSEQAVGALIRWAPVRWFALSANPSAVRAATPAIVVGTRAVTRSGLVDLPIAALLSHSFAVQYAPVLSGGLGLTLPTGDSASGFGSGRVGSELNVGLGFSPTDKVWMNVGAGRSLGGFAVGSAFSGGSSWGDIGAGMSLTDRVSASGGYSTDLGTVDATIGRSTSVNGGVGFAVMGPTTLNVSASHGLSGIAPRWSMALGIGTAFPSLGHAGAGSSPLKKAFGSSSGTGRRKP